MNESGAQERPVHGGLKISKLESLGLCQDEIIDFSANVNPLGPSLHAVDAARNAIGEHLGTDPIKILVGNGSTELIHLLARAYLKGKDSALVFSPTFGEYQAACRLQGVAPVALSPSSSGFHWDVQAAMHRITGLRPSVVFLCNPNNATGIYLREREVAGIVEALRETACWCLTKLTCLSSTNVGTRCVCLPCPMWSYCAP